MTPIGILHFGHIMYGTIEIVPITRSLNIKYAIKAADIGMMTVTQRKKKKKGWMLQNINSTSSHLAPTAKSAYIEHKYT